MIVNYDYSKLRGRIVEKYGSIGNFCDHIGITRQALSIKLCCHRRFKQDEIERFVDALSIDREEIVDYFFKPEVDDEH